MVMIFERHLQVEAHELCEMSVRVGIFGTEDSTHSEHLRDNDEAQGNNSERPVDALAEKHHILTDLQLGIKRC